MQPWMQTLQIRLCATLIPPLLQTAMRTWRIETVMHPSARPYAKGDRAGIFALWHGQMYILLMAVHKDKTALLVSPSKDGELITQSVMPLGFRRFARGSHKREGAKAVRQMHRLTEAGYSVAFMVDGPRGPRHVVKEGVIRLAAQLGVPIVPLTARATRHLFVMHSSWDGYEGPTFFSHMTAVWGEPLHVAADADVAAAQQQLQAHMTHAYHLMGGPSVKS